MSNIFAVFVHNKLFAYLFTFLLILSGLLTLTTIQRDLFPDVEFGEMLITTRYPGAAPEDVELKVTNEIEAEIKTVDGIKKYTSYSMENFSLVHIVIDSDEADQEQVKTEIREAVTRVTELPSEVTESPLVTDLTTSVFPIIEVGLAGEVPYEELREAARIFEKKLENVQGVSKLDRYGYRDREIQIEVSPDKLKAFDVPLSQLIQAIKARNIRATGGSFESYTSEKNIVTLAQFRTPMEVGDVIVRTTFDGPSIKVKDLAVINDDFEDERVLSRMNGVSAISFVALKTENADIVRTVDRIKSLVEQEQKNLPEGITVLYSNDASTYVRNRFGIVANNGLLGLGFLLVTLALFLNIRIAFWVALGIPVSILGALFLLPMFGSSLDSITLTAMVLVIGIVVDDAIIIAENIYQKHEKGLAPLEAAVEGVREVFKPVLTTVLTTFVAFAPMFFLPGMMGKFVYVIPLTISCALFISLFESTIALPSHIAEGLKHRTKVSNKFSLDKHFFERVKKHYESLLKKLLKLRYPMVLVFLSCLGTALWYAFEHLDVVLFPSNTADRFMILLQTPSGTSLEATSDRVKLVERAVESLESYELDSYATRIGTFGDIGSSESENHAAVFVYLTPFSERERSADDIVEVLRAQLKVLKGFEDVRFMVDAGGPPVGRPISIRVVGSADDLRAQLADSLEQVMSHTLGVKDIDRDDKEGKTQLEIKLDYDKLARYALTVADVAQHVRIAYDGELVTNVRYGEEDVDFRVIYPAKARGNPNYLGTLSIPNQQGRLIPLSTLGYFEERPGPANLNHYNGERSVTVTADIDAAVTTSVLATQAILSQFQDMVMYPGVRLVVDGEAEETSSSIKDLAKIFVIAILGIYFLLILLFSSVWQPIIVIMALPFGLTGVIVALILHNEPLGFLASTGVIGLAGVVVNDSLVLVSRINDLRRKNHAQVSVINLVAQGTADRLRAVILTSVTTIAGLLPLAYGLGGSDPHMSPMALTLGYGLLFATPLTLLLLPCIYMIGFDVSRLLTRRSGRV